MTKKRVREKLQRLFITESESQLIETKMREAGICNKSAYYRKAALDGYIVRQDFEPLKGMVRELNKIGSNVNQIAKVANTYGAGEIYKADLEEIQKEIKKIWRQLDSLISK